MKKLLFTFLALSLITILSNAQETTKRCYTTEKYQEAVAENPEILSIQEQLELFTDNYIQNENPESRSTITIPVLNNLIYRSSAEKDIITNAIWGEIYQKTLKALYQEHLHQHLLQDIAHITE